MRDENEIREKRNLNDDVTVVSLSLFRLDLTRHERMTEVYIINPLSLSLINEFEHATFQINQ